MDKIKKALAQRCVENGYNTLFMYGDISVHESGIDIDDFVPDDIEISTLKKGDSISLRPDWCILAQRGGQHYGSNELVVEEVQTFDDGSYVIFGYESYEGELDTKLSVWSTCDFYKEYGAIYKDLTMTPQEKVMFAEGLTKYDKPIYFFNLEDAMDFNRYGCQFKFNGIQPGDTMTFAMNVREYTGNPEQLTTKETKVQFDSVEMIDTYSRGLMAVMNTSAGVFVSVDCSKELHQVQQNREELLKAIDKFATKHVEHEGWFNPSSQISQSDFKAFDHETGQPIEIKDIKPGMTLDISFYTIATMATQIDEDLTRQPTEEKCTIKIEDIHCPEYGPHFILSGNIIAPYDSYAILSTINFSDRITELEMDKVEKSKSIERHIAEDCAYNNRMGLIIKDAVITYDNGEVKPFTHIQAGDHLQITGTQFAYPFNQELDCSLSVSSQIEVQKVFFTDDQDFAVLTNDGVIFSTIDFRQDFAQIQQELKQNMIQQELNGKDRISVEMDENLDWEDPRFDRSEW